MDAVFQQLLRKKTGATNTLFAPRVNDVLPSTNSLLVSWTVPDNIDDFPGASPEIYVSESGGTFSLLASVAQGNLTASSTAFAHTGLGQQATRFYYVRYVTSTQQGRNSNIVFGTTNEASQVGQGWGNATLVSAVIPDNNANRLELTFSEAVTSGSAAGFRLTGGTARITGLISGVGTTKLTFSLTDYVLRSGWTDYKVLYWPEIGRISTGTGRLAGFENVTVQNQANDYYGNGTLYFVSRSGNNNNSGRNSSSPFATFEKAQEEASPGDYILFRRNETWLDEQHWASKNGTVSNRITISTYGTGSKPKFHTRGVTGNYQGYVTRGYTWRISGDYVTLDNLDIETDLTVGGGGSDDGVQIIDSKYAIVSNCEAESTVSGHGHMSFSVNTYVITSQVPEKALFNNTYPQILNCISRGGYRGGIGTKIVTYEGDNEIYEGGLIENCISTRNSADENGSNLWENFIMDRGDWNGFIIRKCEASNHFSAGFECFGARDIIFEYNTVRDSMTDRGQPYGMKMGGSQNDIFGNFRGSKRIIVRYNKIYNIYNINTNAQVGIRTSGSQNGKIYGNLIYRIGDIGIKIDSPMDEIGWDIFNNTVVKIDNQAMQSWSDLNQYSGNVRIRNNILDSINANIFNRSGANPMTVQNNILVQNTTSGPLSLSNNIQASVNDLFVDYANDDYTLAANSPAIDAGVEIGEWQHDIRGLLKLNQPCIGCYENG